MPEQTIHLTVTEYQDLLKRAREEIEPMIAFYTGQSLAPPGHRGLTAGSALWCKIGHDWYRVDLEKSQLKVIRIIKDELSLRKWPFDEKET